MSPLGQASAWDLFHGTEYWGVVWMSDSELNESYRWNRKTKRWHHKTDKMKTIRAAKI